MTLVMPFLSIQSMPNGEYTSGRKSTVRKRSLCSRREAIRMKIRNAVSEKPKPVGGVSANRPTTVSTSSMLR